jgi:uncharacterized protein (TIGR02611 family)
MLTRVKASWKRLIHAPPGVRFQRQHRAHRRRHRNGWSRLATTVGGLVIIAVGIVALPAPGPGLLIIALGAALLARESGPVARWFDRLEVRLRRLIARAVAVWRRSTVLEKVLEAAAGLSLAGVGALLAYSLVAG